MIYQSFSIFDQAAETYSPPFFMPTKGLAIRRFSETAVDKTTQIGMHPMDFTLFIIGEYNDQNGEFSANPTPIAVIKASETLTEQSFSTQEPL